MTFNIRRLNSSDYSDILVGWWNDWGWTPPQKDMLPEDGEGGLIIYDGDTPICAGFLYVTNSKLAWVEWVISNKEYRKKPHRKEAITLLVEKLTMAAKASGYTFAYALLKSKPLIDIYKSLDYIQGDSNATEMIKAL